MRSKQGIISQVGKLLVPAEEHAIAPRQKSLFQCDKTVNYHIDRPNPIRLREVEAPGGSDAGRAQVAGDAAQSAILFSIEDVPGAGPRYTVPVPPPESGGLLAHHPFAPHPLPQLRVR